MRRNRPSVERQALHRLREADEHAVCLLAAHAPGVVGDACRVLRAALDRLIARGLARRVPARRAVNRAWPEYELVEVRHAA